MRKWQGMVMKVEGINIEQSRALLGNLQLLLTLVKHEDFFVSNRNNSSFMVVF